MTRMKRMPCVCPLSRTMPSRARNQTVIRAAHRANSEVKRTTKGRIGDR